MQFESLARATVLTLAAGLPAQLAVTGVAPARNSLSASTSTSIALSFNQPLNPSTVTASTFKVFARLSGPVSGVLSLADSNRRIDFVPNRPMFPGEPVLVYASSSIAAAAGGNLIGGHCWYFYTRPAPGSMSFTRTQTINIRFANEGGIGSYGSYCGDVDHDGSPDFSIPNEFADDIRVMRNDGCGNFTAPQAFALPSGSQPSPNEAGDLNQDGHIDLVTGNMVGNTISVMFGNGTTGYGNVTTYPTGNDPRGVAVLDLEGDGDLDVVTANQNSSNLAFHRNQGNGTFAAATFMEGGGNGETGVAAADVNSDGWMDLYVGHFFSQTVTTLINNGNGTFRIAASMATGGSPWMIASGDMNNDGIPDVVSAMNNVNRGSVIRGDGSGGMSPATIHQAGNSPISVKLGDLDGDGDLEFVLSNYSSSDYQVHTNLGGGTFGSMQNHRFGVAGSCVIIADWDRDGDMDWLGVDEIDDKLYLYRQNGPSPSGVQPLSCAAALRIDELGNRGGYGSAPAHPVVLGSRFFLGVSGSANAAYALFLSTPLQPGLTTNFGLLNLDVSSIVSVLAATTNSAGEAMLPVPVPANLGIGVGVAFQGLVVQAASATLTNPERVITTQ